MSTRIVSAVLVVVWFVAMGAAFAHNLHSGGNWCAHPDRPGNWMVVDAGFCK